MIEAHGLNLDIFNRQAELLCNVATNEVAVADPYRLHPCGPRDQVGAVKDRVGGKDQPGIGKANSG